MVVAFDRAADAGLLSIAQAAELAGVHRSTIRAWCDSGRLPSVRVERRRGRAVHRADVERLVAARASGSANANPPPPSRRRAAPLNGHAHRTAEEPHAATDPLPPHVPDPAARAAALGRIAAELSTAPNLPTLFEDLLDDSVALFGVDRAGLWLYDGSAHPFQLALQRGVPAAILSRVAELEKDDDTAGLRALRSRAPVAHDVRTVATSAALRDAYESSGIASVCFVPIVYRDDPVGLLALYHDRAYGWSPDELELARSFGDGMAAAIANARLVESADQLSRRLTAIEELASRLNRIQDAAGIGAAIVAEAGQLIEFDAIDVYHVDHAAAVCEPISWGGRLRPPRAGAPDGLRVSLGSGAVGWVAAHNAPLRVGDTSIDPRTATAGVDVAAARSMLLVPMSFEDRVYGVIAVSHASVGRFDADDERTLAIFAGYAAQAIVNAETVDQVRRQRAELEHRLASQRRLLEVNERLLSTLDPQAVLELIADSLKTVVAYDSLTIYRVDRQAHVRRAVVARDRYAELILQHEGAAELGITGWCIRNAEAVLSNDAHLDPRSVQIPGTPEEPESLIVVPLQVRGEVIGTLNVSRIGSGPEARFTENEFELTKLFAGQASIALQNAEAHGEVATRADHDSLTGLRNHGAFQRELGEALARGGEVALLMMDLNGFKTFNDTHGHPAGDALLADVARVMSSSVRDKDAVYRYGGDEFVVILAGASRGQAHDVGERIRGAVAALPAADDETAVTVSIGVAVYPEDGQTKDELVRAADQALYLAKPSARQLDAPLATHDTYLSALDETAIALMARSDPTTLLETIIRRGAQLLGTPHGYIYLADDTSGALECRVGIGLFARYIGYRLPRDAGVGGRVMETGEPFAVEDYDEFIGRAPDMPRNTFGAVVGVPLTSGARVVGVLGVAAGGVTRRFGTRDIAALSRFAQLASIALDNVRLAEAARRGALYDPVTGLPNRELLTDRVAHALSSARPRDPKPFAVILLDVDRFKVVNESIGHAGGDRLLSLVAERLVGALRPGDTVARFGGDEFGIIVDPVVDEVEALAVVERIGNEMKAPFELAGRQWFISASIGITVGRTATTTPDDLLREAEIALVRAKADGSIRHALFEPSMSEATLERVDLENDLRLALERDELRLHYQPIVELRTERIVGVEALVRWEHPERGWMAPLSFVPVAEETGLIVPLGRWVLEEACRQVNEWRRAYTGRPLTVSVNLSAREFAQPDLVGHVADVLARTGLPPDALELEITESVVMDESETGSRTLRALRDLGVSLSLDDFGTGYSSLSYLRHLPLDTIKVDRSFVNGLAPGGANLPIVDAVISLAHGLGMGVVAEGIENGEEAESLMALGCDLGQGYRWAPPLPADQIAALLAADAS